MGKLAHIQKKLDKAQSLDITDRLKAMHQQVAQDSSSQLAEQFRSALQDVVEHQGRFERNVLHRLKDAANAGDVQKILAQVSRDTGTDALSQQLMAISLQLDSLPQTDLSATNQLIMQALDKIKEPPEIVFPETEHRPLEWVFEIERHKPSGLIKRVTAKAGD